MKQLLESFGRLRRATQTTIYAEGVNSFETLPQHDHIIGQVAPALLYQTQSQRRLSGSGASGDETALSRSGNSPCMQGESLMAADQHHECQQQESPLLVRGQEKEGFLEVSVSNTISRVDVKSCTSAVEHKAAFKTRYAKPARIAKQFCICPKVDSTLRRKMDPKQRSMLGGICC
ncbi:hypothetical protein [Novipirellula caenicola]|uniref:hypothetical protein n=1 Tax=Novipirellula caenicola TaxID=1536901 RepID=UPI0031F136E9